jgi:glycosyltransferase involved in cell wall biosynthesis
MVTSLQVGGAETQVVNLAQRLQARNWDVTVVSLLASGAHASTLAQSGIPVHSLEMKRGLPDPRAVFRLASIVRAVKPDIVHSHMVHANLLARFTRLVQSIPALICTAHNTRETSERGGPTWYKERLYGITDALADSTTIICQAGWDHYVATGAAPADRLQVIPNGIDCQRFAPNLAIRSKMRSELGIAADEFVWLAAARLVLQKDFPNLLHAFSPLRGGKWKLLIAGDGPLRPQLEQLGQELGLSTQVQFLGVRRDISNLHNAADAFVLSSEMEGLPLSVLEAAASGLPSVVTDVGGTREAVLDGTTGFVVPPRDSSALSSALTRLMTLSPADLRRFATSARAHCLSRFEINSVVDRWEELYQRNARSSSTAAKIVYVITRADRGGAQIHVQDLLANAPFECQPVLVTGEPGYLCDWARERQIPTIIISSLRQPMSPLQDLRALVKLVGFFRSESPALVHAHTSKAGLLCRFAGVLTRTPVVFTAHTWSFADGISRLQQAIALPLERMAARWSGKVIAVSQANADAAFSRAVVKRSKLVTIWNGMPDSPFRATPGMNQDLTVSMVARFAPQKDQATLVKAFRQLSLKASWRLLLVGDGPTRHDIEKLVASLGLSDNILFLGDRSDVMQILATCDLFVLSTHWEGLPLSILEAMRAGLPVIATNVGGCAEAVTPGVTGLLTERGDQAGLARGIETLLSSRELLRSMGAAGRARFQKDFRIENMLAKTWEVYQSEVPELRFTASLQRLQAQLQSGKGSKDIGLETAANLEPQPPIPFEEYHSSKKG